MSLVPVVGVIVTAAVALALSGASYVAGTIAHEVTHVLAAVATGAHVERLHPTAVTYVAPDERADAVIRAAPVVVGWAVAVLAAVQLVRVGLTPSTIYLAVFVGGYFPRSPGDWRGLSEAVAAYSSEPA